MPTDDDSREAWRAHMTHGADAATCPVCNEPPYEPTPLQEAARLRQRMIYTDPAVRAVIDAWKVPGPMPAFHTRAQRKLLAEWPVLAKAVAALAALDRADG